MGVHPLQYRQSVQQPASVINGIARRHNVKAIFHAFDIRGVADLAEVALWPHRGGGIDAAQATVSEQPAYNAVWPSITADSIGEAVIAPAVDFSATDKVCVMIVTEHAAGLSGGTLRAAAEQGRYFARLEAG